MTANTESPLVARVRTALVSANQSFLAPYTAANAATDDPKRDAMMARLVAATDNQERWELAEAINALPPVEAF